MQAGDALLWFDDSPTRETADKIRNATARYRQKFHHDPEVCYVHPASLVGGGLAVVDDVKVMGSKSVLPFHFWLDVAEQKRTTPGAKGPLAARRPQGAMLQDG